MNRPAGMTLEQVVAVMDILRSLGCRFWLEGGWGVDALVGRQTRPHRDVDIDFDGTFEEEVLAALLHVGYAIEMDWRPNRVELGAPGRGWIDLHPLVLDDEGNARQAAIGGGWHEFPRSFFTVGCLGGDVGSLRLAGGAAPFPFRLRTPRGGSARPSGPGTAPNALTCGSAPPYARR